MAIVWQHNKGSTRYEVRSAGATRRLYTNGAFHSQHNPHHLFTGGIWDLLVVPALYFPVKRPKILILGVGGGAAIHLFNQLIDQPDITGIEYDKTHLRIAKDFFGCNASIATLIHADAYQWIEQNNGKYHVLLDDLFVDGPDDPVRPKAVNWQWIKQLSRKLTEDGILIQNHLSPTTARTTARDAKTRKLFRHALLFHHPRYANGILALYRRPVDIRHAREALKQSIKTTYPGELKRLSYRVETLY